MVSLFGTNDKLALEIDGLHRRRAARHRCSGLLGRRDARLAMRRLRRSWRVVGSAAHPPGPARARSTSPLITVARRRGRGHCHVRVAGLDARACVSDLRAPSRAERDGRASMPRRGLPGHCCALSSQWAAVLSVIGRVLGSQVPASSTGPMAVPPPSATVPPLPAGADFGITGLTPIIVPNDDFYQIDTRLARPADRRLDLVAAHPRHGRQRGHAELRPAAGHAADRAVRDHLVRLERGRRPARGQCQVDRRQPQLRARHGRRPGRCDAGRGPRHSTAGPAASPRPTCRARARTR